MADRSTPLRPASVLAILCLAALETLVAATVRVEENSAMLTYAGAWDLQNGDRAWSGVAAAVSTEALARVTFSFTGTGVSWIGFRGPQAGRARVFLDGTRVATIDAYAAAEELQAVLYTKSGLIEGAHTLAIEVTGQKHHSATDNYIVVDAFDVVSGGGGGAETFAPGDVFVSIEPGPVQWRRSTGTLVRTLAGVIPGYAEGMGFDAAGKLYVTRWRLNVSPSTTGNTTEVFDVNGQPAGTYGSGYDCDPHAIVFAPGGTGYVGQAGCTGAVLKFVPGQPPVALPVAPDYAGAFWLDLGADGCTLFYTSWGPNVKRYDGCARVQRTNFNKASLPGGEAHDLRVLPDGGVIVSSGDVIARLDASGSLVRTYQVTGEYRPWTGLDLVGDGTFWAGNYESSNVYRFDLVTGAVLSAFNTGTARHTVVDVLVRK
jgi:hypothetical protein